MALGGDQSGTRGRKKEAGIASSGDTNPRLGHEMASGTASAASVPRRTMFSTVWRKILPSSSRS